MYICIYYTLYVDKGVEETVFLKGSHTQLTKILLYEQEEVVEVVEEGC